MYLTPCSCHLLSRHMPTLLMLRRGTSGRFFLALTCVIATSSACVARPPQEIPPAPVPVPQEATPPLAQAAKQPLTADSANYLLLSHTKTLEESAPDMPADSITIREKILIRLLPDSSQTALAIELRSDSGYSLPPDRNPPPETIRKESEPVAATAIASWKGADLRLRHLMTPACPSSPTLVSQLIPLILARFIAARTTTREPTDSIHYASCTGGVQLANTLRFSRVTLDDSSLEFNLSFSSDSSRTLPMNTHGIISGKATVVPSTGTTAIPDRLSVSLDGHLTASSSVRQQRFRHYVYLELTRQ